MGYLLVRRSPSLDINGLAVLVREAVVCGLLVLGLSLLSDRLYYGEWTLPAYKFLYFNLNQGLAEFYGKNDWHYYLSQGVPLLTLTSLPLAVWGWLRPASIDSAAASSALNILARVVTMTIISLSLVSHKEVRFIYPLLPIFIVLASPYAARTFTLTYTAAADAARPQLYVVRRRLLSFLLLLNVVVAGYLTITTHPAPISVMHFLRRAYEQAHPEVLKDPTWQPPADELFALFLMPCHSTPWRSHLVYPGLHARALTCEPPLDTAPGSVERLEYRDEADRFYDGPVAFLGSEVWLLDTASNATCAPAAIPRYIVGFEGVATGLNMYLDRANRFGGTSFRLETAWEGWNGVFHEDWRRRGRVMVWKTLPGKKHGV